MKRKVYQRGKYWIYRQDMKGFERITGKRVTIPGFTSLDLFSHRTCLSNILEGAVTISDGVTGAALVIADTLEQAIEVATSLLKHHKREGYEKMQENAFKITGGVSPRYISDIVENFWGF